jgi:hypothetical protein
MGKQTFYKSLQIANPQIFALIQISQFRKCLKCASPQITNPQIFMINPQIANPQVLQNTNLSQKSPKIVLFLTIFKYVQILIRGLYAKFVRKKSMYLRTCGRSMSANHKQG